MPRLVLVHSPLVGPSPWRALADELARLGFAVTVPSLQQTVHGRPPYGPAFAAAVRGAVPKDEQPLVLVAHSGAGLFLPAISSAFEHAAGYLFIDASLPKHHSRWIDSIPAEARESDDFVEAQRRGVFPNPWRDPALWRQVGVADDQALVFAAEAVEGRTALYREAIEVPAGWPAAPAAYLAFVPNPFYAPIAEEARRRGFVVREMRGSHFEFAVRPAAVAAEVTALVEELLA